MAGSDTTAATLTALIFEILSNKTKLDILQTEIDEYCGNHTGISSQSLAKLEYLDAVIQETLRLHPPVPSGLQRLTPPEGVTIDGIFIPGDTIIQIPSHTVYRDPRYFVKPNHFIPERWTTEKHLTLNSACFAPFSTGKRSYPTRVASLCSKIF